MTTNQARDRVSSHGTFLSMPAVFRGVDEGLAHALKIEVSPTVQETRGTGRTAEISFGTTVIADRMLVDFGAVRPEAIDLDQVARDCDLVKHAIEEHPEVLRNAVAALAAGSTTEQVDAAAAAVEDAGLSEQGALRNGGGILALIILVCALACVGGCSSAHGTGTSMQPAEHPQSPPPVDAGPG
jgi:hypothetical protein